LATATRSALRVRFWGTRGSIAKPGPTTVRYGGNTSCVEVRGPDGTLTVLDCGTGAHELGQALLAAEAHHRGHLLISHTHWDHIQGFPFFAPLFARDSQWDVYAPRGVGRRLEATLAGQMEYAYFPVTLGQMEATIRCHDCVEGSFDLGAIRVTAQYLNHPALALGYRLDAGGAAVVFATDHEPHSPHQPAAADPRAARVHREDQRHIEFLAGADLVIHDAQYTLEEYGDKIGWGHSPAELVVDMALAAGARRLALFHHDPLRTDEAVDWVVKLCRDRVASAGGRLEVFAAAEGQELDIGPREGGRVAARPTARAVMEGAADASEPATILVVDDDPDVLRVMVDLLVDEGFDVLSARDGETALELARARVPNLLLLDWKMPGLSGLDVCQALRADPDPRLRAVPVVLVTAFGGPEDTATGFAAGVTDFVTKPFRPQHLLTRVQAWLLRSRPDAT